MSLPRISPYRMPTEVDVPAGRVEWLPDPSRAALLVHDMQEHFLAPFERDREPLPELFANIRRLRDRCAELGMPVIYSAQPAGQDREQRGLLQDFWGDGIVNAEGEAIAPEVALRDGDELMPKWRYSALVRTDLRDRLRAGGRDQLVICGIYAHIGCLMTATHAFMEEIEPFLVADAVADFSRDDHDMAVDWAARRCATVTTTGRLLGAFSPDRGLEAPEFPVEMPVPDTAGPHGQEPRLDREGMRADLLAALADPPDALGDDDSLLDLGLDSISLMAVVTAWRERGVEIALEDLVEHPPTVAAWWPVVEEALSRPAPV